jgi:branched-chain amino acid transport system permease protein
MSIQTILLAALDGLSYGAQVFLVAVGLSLIFGVLRIVNVAHGSFYAIGAYVAASFSLLIAAEGWSPWLTYPAMILSACLVGIVLGGALEVGLLRRIYGKEQVLQLLVTFAVFMILEDMQKAVWGVSPYFIDAPLGLLGTVSILGINYSIYQLVIVPFFAAVVLVSLRYVLRRTRLGRIVTAVTDDREIAAAMGVDATRIYLLTFMIGASFAAFGGALASGSTSLVPGMGAGMTILSFAIAATAGLGRIEGAAVAALMIGLGRSLAVYMAPEFDVLVPYLIMFLVLLFKPQGLFSVQQTRKV